ncbi:MAG: hypothetical protein M3Z26_10765 [Bacteroidota bacterium]|nr:hypothetical protein [Bacteroidota bacterium]
MTINVGRTLHIESSFPLAGSSTPNLVTFFGTPATAEMGTSGCLRHGSFGNSIINRLNKRSGKV